MLTLKEICESTGGRCAFQRPLKIKGVSIDSRKTKKGYVFVAVKGRRFDGHAFIPQAIQNGAAAVVCSRSIKNPEPGVAFIRVTDTIHAMGRMAHVYRNKFPIPLIAVIGSAGKTTTKELIAHVLSCGYRVLKNDRSENNFIGVPLTLFKLNARHQLAVLELGTNQPGDIAGLFKIVMPSTVVLTNIGESHLERLKNVAGVFKEKSSFLRLMPKGTVIYNNDDPYLRKIPRLSQKHRYVTYSIKEKGDYQSMEARASMRRLTFRCRGHNISLATPAWHNMYNALAAICCGRLYKISYNKISQSLSRYRFKDGRMHIEKKNGLWIIDDSYNANPVSFLSAIRTLNAFSAGGRKIIVCADMLELGSASTRAHRQVGRELAGSDIDCILSYGKGALKIHQEICRLNLKKESRHYKSLPALIKKLRALAAEGGVVLIKGSRGMKLDRVARALRADQM